VRKKYIVFISVLAALLAGWFLMSKENREEVATIAGDQIIKREVSAKEIPVEKMYENAEELLQERKLQEAKDEYQKIITKHPDYDKIEEVQKKLEGINMEIILSNAPSKYNVIHQVQGGDTLGKIALKYGTTVRLIKRKNNLKSDIIRVGQKLTVWTGKFNIFVDKSQNILLLKIGDEIVKVYNVSTGENNSTPVGEFKIDSRLENPVWFNKGAVVPPESPENVLGSRWLGFDTMPGYGIHGTTDPDSIGTQATAGCVRLRNSEVEELFDLIPVGTKVAVVD